MYRFIRKIHLYVALSLLTFVAMYFVTGYVLIHGDFFPASEPQKAAWTTSLATAAPTLPDEPTERAHALKDALGLAGKTAAPKRQKDGRAKYEYFRPGERYEVVLSATGAEAKITRTRGGFREVMVGFHRLHGYSGGWVYVLWALCYDLASLSLLVFVATGIWMWWKLKPRRWLGWLCLGGSLTYTIATVIYFVRAP